MLTFKSEEWKFVKDKLQDKLDNARSIIEQKTTTLEDTAFYRGQIALCKELMKLPESVLLRAQETI